MASFKQGYVNLDGTFGSLDTASSKPETLNPRIRRPPEP